MLHPGGIKFEKSVEIVDDFEFPGKFSKNSTLERIILLFVIFKIL